MNLIDQSHPSFGCQNAWFLFGVLGTGKSVVKMLLVEAKGPWAVQTIERILMQDGSVNDNCVVLLVQRNDPNIGIRAEIVEEMSYVDFMLDVVEPKRLLTDALVSTSLRKSLTDEERAYASKKLDSMTSAESIPTTKATKAVPRPTTKVSALRAVPTPIVSPEAYERLSGGLLGLGFKKPEVKRFIDGLGNRLQTEPLESLIRLGIQELNAA